jgi:uncharacterized membrane protein
MRSAKPIFRHPLIILLFILTLALALRIYHLGDSSLWHDEALTAAKTCIPFSQIREAISLTGEENPPGYFFLIDGWSMIFGKSEFSLRFPSLIFSLLSVFLVYLIGKNLFSERIGLIAAFLVAISPYSINYAQEARLYSLLWLMGAISFLAFIHFLRDGKISALTICVLINALSLYISFAGGFYILTQNVIFLILLKPKLLIKWVTSQFVTIGLGYPCLLLANRAIFPPSSAGNWRGAGVDYIELLRGLASYLSGSLKGEYAAAAVMLFLFLIILGCFSFSSSGLKISLNRNDLFLWGWFLIPLITAYIYNSFSSSFLISLTIRYVGFIHIPFLIGAAKGLDKLRGSALFIALLLVTALIFTGQLFPYYKNNAKIGSENWRDLIARLDREAEEGDLVICPGGMIHSYHYYHRIPLLKAIWVPDLKNIPIKPGSGSIFVLYRQWREKESYKNLPGHHLIGHLSQGNIGAYKFRKEGSASEIQ